MWTGPSKADPAIWMAIWLPDRTMNCPHCGPWVRQQKAAAYLAKIGDQQLYGQVVPNDRWASLARAFRRAEVDYLQVPTTDGQRLVLINAPWPGFEPVAKALVTEAIASAPADAKMKISASTAWTITPPRVKPVDVDQRKAYDLRFLVAAGLEHLRQVTRELGVYLEEAGRDGSAFLFRRPDDELVWRQVVRWGGLWDPTDERARRRQRAA